MTVSTGSHSSGSTATGKVTLDQEFYTPVEVASLLRLEVRTVRQYLKSGKLKGQKMGTLWRISQAQLRDFFDERFGFNGPR